MKRRILIFRQNNKLNSKIPEAMASGIFSLAPV